MESQAPCSPLSRDLDILEREARGLFVPVCTRNIFLKAYTAETAEMNMTIWEEQDKINYVNRVKEILNEFFEGEVRK